MNWCKEMIEKRDTYRYTGRGQGGLELHYNLVQCKRPAGASGYCWQHDPKRLSYRIKRGAR